MKCGQHRDNGLDMNVIDVYQHWGITGRGTVVSILDDGIEKDHPDLVKNYVRHIHFAVCYYPAIRSIQRDTKFTVAFSFFECTVTDFSTGALRMGVKFYTAVRPHFGQVFSCFRRGSSRDGRVFADNRGHMAGYTSC